MMLQALPPGSVNKSGHFGPPAKVREVRQCMPLSGEILNTQSLQCQILVFRVIYDILTVKCGIKIINY